MTVCFHNRYTKASISGDLSTLQIIFRQFDRYPLLRLIHSFGQSRPVCEDGGFVEIDVFVSESVSVCACM